MGAEVPVYHDENIHVTNLRAMLQGRTYAMANVTSVSMYTQAGNPLPGILLAMLGAVSMLTLFAGKDAVGCALFFGLPLFIVGIVYTSRQTNLYWVRIGSASGETNALSSRDRDYILRIVGAMNEAIVMRG